MPSVELARETRRAALKAAEIELETAQWEGDEEDQAAALAAAGTARLGVKKAEEAASAFREAYDLYVEMADEDGQVTTQVGLAAAEQACGNSAKALAAAESARKLAEQAGQLPKAIEALNVGMEAAFALGKSDTAVRFAKDALLLRRRDGNTKDVISAERAIIHACLRAGDTAGALRAAKKACARMFEAGDWQGQASMLRMAAEVHLQMGRADVARQAAEEALEVLRANKALQSSSDAGPLRSIVAEAFVAKGEEPPMSGARVAALGALGQLESALKTQSQGAIKESAQKLEAAGAYTQRDMALVLGPVTQNDPSAAAFIRRHMPNSTISEDPATKAQVASLRQFSVEPARGETDKVKWVQTMGKMTLSYAIDGDALTEDAIDMQLSKYQLQVSLNGKKLTSMSGQLAGYVDFDKCWWKLHKEEARVRTRGVENVTKKLTLVVQLVKSPQKAWPRLWYKERAEMANPAARGHFSWTEDMHEVASQETEKSTLKKLPLGSAAADGTLASPTAAPSGRFTFAPDDLCVGLAVSQTDTTIVVSVHFDAEAIRVAQETVALEELLAADVSEETVSIFLRGHEQFPILSGTLTRPITPERTTWSLSSSGADTFRHRQREPSAPVPVLEVRLAKGSSQGRWPTVFATCWQHRLMLKNYDELEELQYFLQEDESARKALAEREANPKKAKPSDEEDGEEGGEGGDAGKDAVDDAAEELALKAAVLTDEQREDLRSRLAAWRPQRWEGLPGAKLIGRSDLELQDGTFSIGVSGFVDEMTKRTGCAGNAQWNSALGRYSYMH